MSSTHPIKEFVKTYAGGLLFLFFCLIGLFTFQSYGIAWDEDYQREIGIVSWNYVFSNDQGLLSYPMRDYGVAFELPLIAFEKLFHFTDEKEIYLMRHLLTHLFFLVGDYYCFKLIDLLYKKKSLACIGFLLFVLHPLIYAHSFFNTKDLPFLSMLSICFYYSARAFKEQTWLSFLVLGITYALLINIRVMGLLPFFCVIGVLFLRLFFAKDRYKTLGSLGVLLSITIIVLYVIWPYLWSDPLQHFAEVFKNMSRFRWPHANLFKGNMIPATELSWDYIPLWFSITTPISFLVLGLVSFFIFMYHLIKKIRSVLKDDVLMNTGVYLICFFVPLLAVILLHSVLYDGWRHLYFIYPPFVLLCVFGINFFLERFNKSIKIYLALSFLTLTFFIVRNFPLQHLYFNAFVNLNKEPDYIRKHYDMDYWGLSFKEGLDYILKNDSSKDLKLYVEQYPSDHLYILLDPEKRKRVHFVFKEEADYFMTNYRWHPQDYPDTNKVHSIKVMNTSVLDIFKMK